MRLHVNAYKRYFPRTPNRPSYYQGDKIKYPPRDPTRPDQPEESYDKPDQITSITAINAVESSNKVSGRGEGGLGIYGAAGIKHGTTSVELKTA